jgi:ABC-type molybdate transport system substrate-binding protein
MTGMDTDIPVIPTDRLDDLHHLESAADADLVLFVAGNQFMAMDKIIAVFQSEYPEIEKIFYETLPPGLELKQILSGGAIFRNDIIRIQPDVYTSVSKKAMETLEAACRIAKGDYHLYLHNRLTLMVPTGNPADIRSVVDLGREDVRISQPDPANEDIAYHIMDMYFQAGGKHLVARIMEEKKAAGTTIYTTVHHRETPWRIAAGEVDVGPVWATETLHAESQGLAFGVVEPGEKFDRRDHINYYVCRLSGPPNSENAKKFINFICSSTAQNIYRDHGFVPL